MKYILVSLFGLLLLMIGCIDDESHPLIVFPSPPVSVIDTVGNSVSNAPDSTNIQADTCYERISTLRTIEGCSEYVEGYINSFYFSALADVTMHEQIAPNHTAINIRSYRDGEWYAFDLALTMNGEPDSGRIYPLTTEGDAFDRWHAVDVDSIYVVLGLWLDFADLLNPELTYKSIEGVSNWIQIDSSSYGLLEGEPVIDHFGALEATLVLNQSQINQDDVAFYRDRGFCVPDTIFLRDICFDARTRDVFSPCDRVSGR